MLSPTAYTLQRRRKFPVPFVAFPADFIPSSVALIVVIVETNFFERKFGVTLNDPSRNNGTLIDKNDPQLHMIAYLQVAIISQALIFVTRAHSFFFMERPSFALLGAFAVAQLVSSIIAAYGDWGFTNIHSISGGWIGIIWVWVSERLFLSIDYH
jgi:H+-transporting ATPase